MSDNNAKEARHLHLVEILDRHKANLCLPLTEQDGGGYNEYHAAIAFEDGKIMVQIYNEEGWHYDLNEEDGMPFEWAEQITTFVNALKQAGRVPEYTLELIPKND